MEIKAEIVIREAKRPGLEIVIPETEGDDILTLKLKGRLTPQVAAILQCDYLYTSGGSPQDGFKDTNLTISLVDMILTLASADGKAVMDSFYPEQIFGFRVYKVGENALNIQFRARTTGRLQEILDFFRANRGEGFTISIKPRQGELFDGGTRVEMSDGDTGEVIASAEPTGGPLTDIINNTLGGIAAASADPPVPIPDPAMAYLTGEGLEAFMAGPDENGDPHYRLYENGFFTGVHRVSNQGPLKEEYTIRYAPAEEKVNEPPLAPRPRRQRRAVHGVEVSKPEPPAPEPQDDGEPDEPWAS
jgi:hypothetical protein